ncbi:MAG: site-specific DNA-methyltransferase [Bdellovibrionales bacterium]|nr:site-specific DNA-methyltransferase [Bdellovibrionales bacterium]
MEKLKMHSPDFTKENIARLAELFPNCVTESQANDGTVMKAIDFDLLRQELSDHIVDGSRERYQLTWPGKREALLAASAPIAKTLRPDRKQSVSFDETSNIFIEGDNLEALKLLQETYLNKIKMIYIDPPYNTGHDFIYSDSFAESVSDYLDNSRQVDEVGNRLVSNPEANGRFHSDWLSMIYPRLKLARNLLRDDGVVFISIDDNEFENLRKICDELFGEENFVGVIAWKNKYGAGAKTRTFIEVHEYIVCYSRTQISDIQSPLSDEQIDKYSQNKDEKFAERGGYVTQPLMTNSLDDRASLQYDIEHDGDVITPRKQWVWSKERLLESIERNEVVFKKKKNGEYSVRAKVYLKDEAGSMRKGKPLSLISGPYNQEGTQEVAELLGNSVFSFPKPVSLIKSLFAYVVNGNESNDGIYLDFFAGSCTSAHAILSLNAMDGGRRRFIAIQLPEDCPKSSVAFKKGYSTIAEIGMERIRRAGQKLKEEAGLPCQDLDIGFRVLKVDTSNMKDVYYNPDSLDKDDLFDHIENIKENRTPEDLLFQVLLDWGVDLSLPIAREEIDGKTVFFVDENALAACFDKGVSEDLVKQLAARKPLRVVFRDAGFADDSVKINVEQIFKLMSPDTEVKAI